MYLLNNQVLLIFKGGFRVIIFPFFFIISKVINYLVRVKRVNLESGSMVPLARSLSGAQHNVCMYCFVDFLCLTCAQAKKNLVSFLEIGRIKTFYGSFAA